jgi:tetratricopeptide (TPR) repeat protein
MAVLAYADLGRVEEAVGYHEQALEIARGIGDRRNEAIHSWNLGLLYEENDPTRAAELMQVLVDYERAIGHPDAEAHAQHLAAVQRRAQEGS